MDSVKIGEKIRAQRLALGLTQEDVAAAAGTTQSTIERIEAGEFKRMPSALPKIALRLSLKLGDLDPELATTAPIASPRTIIPDRKLVGGDRDFPIHAAAEGGAGQVIISSDPVDWMPRPAPVMNVKDAYGLYVVGDSMTPEFEPGDIAIVNPHLPLVGDTTCVFYQEADGEARATIKRLRRHTPDAWFLRQWNPPDGQKHDFTLSRRDWRLAHRVVGRYSRS